MKLNPDCIRDILLEVEEKTDLSHVVEFTESEPITGRLARYSRSEIVYHIKQCDLNGYFA